VTIGQLINLLASITHFPATITLLGDPDGGAVFVHVKVTHIETAASSKPAPLYR